MLSSSIFSRTGGFSLTEVLVTMFVLALSSTAIMATAPRPSKAIDVEARKFGAVISALSDAAIGSGQLHGVRLRDTGYDTMALVGDTWMVRDSIEGGDYAVTGLTNAPTRLNQSAPDIVADTTGFVTTQQISITIGTTARRLDVLPNGDVAMEHLDD